MAFGNNNNNAGGGGTMMMMMLGLLRISVIRGINLAKRDSTSSDPYVIVKMGKQKLKTRVVKKSLNPEWNEELTLSITDPNLPIKFLVYDKDTFFDDKMGDAELDIKTFIEIVNLQMKDAPDKTIITTIKPQRDNCLSEESSIVWEDGNLVQHMFLRLRNVESGEIELKLRWINVPSS
ncbi:GTPase activating protein 1-like [Andrographis paniculata]|uniref:GTPase activating protein 1-like n=1 Tax=Andrographis paniculata TaxID=175694 RepID=UPI0021E9592E|nr:GTPase activating protein 1-like [Andrographis paniculata]